VTGRWGLFVVSLGLQLVWLMCITGFAFSCKRLAMIVDYYDTTEDEGKHVMLAADVMIRLCCISPSMIDRSIDLHHA
jgi:hypothetical protein